ncbi:ABC transporter-related protein [Shimwellia blattae DSM 4481 = NBRC 105725]|uniref:ABC transporter-related protein n=1 Tax=Shimwellia blattae (strain ATCC 29907 / DSM 4481 / JCM 1650 / NBRC 105725 / CDC 9005-74) TaxID=630626 RepID=I2B8H1_SHIBC|nr:ABC transporter ATP-binding protein [Shimwellia blattae]AFJ46825.1 ABC transporter-related protein [Shimwellia blattae DSM 4481 = NBRC 105725]GAB82965.1 putative ABC transporter ATP-binding protein [Shimwellia blattae DSM 4481 = NBRC 105725]VEC22429.1 Bicarbonate transport ATP-binding protein CmpC [Shimwellia blattae]
MTRRTTPPGIQVRDLSLRFGDNTLFSGLNFTIEGGRFVSLLGVSGTGKTSLLQIIAGLLPPTTGSVSGSDGQPLSGRIAWMGQKDLLYPWLTIAENVALGARLRKEPTDRPWVEHLLERVGLADYARAMPATLSGGMRQRAAIARTLYERKPIVLMDEPFSALDALTRSAIQELAAELLADNTVLLITHDTMEACRLSHRLLVLSRGPGGLDDNHPLTGQPPRAPDDPQLLHDQARLLLRLTGAL